MSLLVAVEHREAARQGTADENSFETSLHKALANAVDSDRTDVEGFADLLIGPG